MITIFFLLPCFLHMDDCQFGYNKQEFLEKKTQSLTALSLPGWALTSFHLLGWCLDTLIRCQVECFIHIFEWRVWMKDHMFVVNCIPANISWLHTLIYLLLLSGVARAHTNIHTYTPSVRGPARSDPLGCWLHQLILVYGSLVPGHTNMPWTKLMDTAQCSSITWNIPCDAHHCTQLLLLYSVFVCLCIRKSTSYLILYSMK
jgi:hypothetical protein